MDKNPMGMIAIHQYQQQKRANNQLDLHSYEGSNSLTQPTCNIHQTFQPLSSQLQPQAASSHVVNMVKFELNS